MQLEGDPFARQLLPSPGLIERIRGRPWGVSLAEAQYVLRRSNYFDHALTQYLTAPDPGQVVLIAGDYDTRPWRFADALKSQEIFAVAEVEMAERIRVSPEGPLSVALRSVGFSPSTRSLFLWEGGALFASRAEVKATLSGIRSLCTPRSLLVLDGRSMVTSPAQLSHLGCPIRFAIHPEDLTGLLSRLDFEVIDVADAKELGRRFQPEGRLEAGAGFVMTARLAGL